MAFLREMKIHSKTSFGEEVKLSTHVVSFCGMLKVPSDVIEILIGKIQRTFLSQCLPALLLGVSVVTRA
jgi:hypothetical protein